jgi:hypothetical protein
LGDRENALGYYYYYKGKEVKPIANTNNLPLNMTQNYYLEEMSAFHFGELVRKEYYATLTPAETKYMQVMTYVSTVIPVAENVRLQGDTRGCAWHVLQGARQHSTSSTRSNATCTCAQ